MFYELIKDKEKQKVPSRFINTLARVCLEVALNVGIKKVCLSGGVMQERPSCEQNQRASYKRRL